MNCVIKIKTIPKVDDLINRDLDDIVKVNGDSAALTPFLGGLYAIGFMNCEDGSYKDFFLDDYHQDEAELLQSFLTFVNDFVCRNFEIEKWITWNGKTFDIPFLLHRIYILTRNQKLSFPNGFELFRLFPSFNKIFPYQKFDKFNKVPYIAEEVGVMKPYVKLFLEKDDDTTTNMLPLIACSYNLDLRHEDVRFKDMIEFDQLNFGNPNYKKMEFYKHLLENEVSFIEQLKELAI